jgi:hypothetical protein
LLQIEFGLGITPARGQFERLTVRQFV